MLRTTGIYFIILVMILVKCFLPDEKPEIIPFPLQSVSDKGDFTFMPLVMVKKTGIVPSGLVNVKNEVKHNRAKGNKSSISIIF